MAPNALRTVPSAANEVQPPARSTSSASPEASMTTRGTMARRPAVVCTSTAATSAPRICTSASTTLVRTLTPVAAIHSSATCLNRSGSYGMPCTPRTMVDTRGLPSASQACRRDCSSFHNPPTTGRKPSSVWRKAPHKPPSVTALKVPPRNPWRSINSVLAPARLAAAAAARPAAPAPTMSTSGRAIIGVLRAGSSSAPAISRNVCIVIRL